MPLYATPSGVAKFPPFYIAFKGFAFFLSNPRLWVVPLLASALLAVLTLAAATGSVVFLWPSSDIGFWSYILKAMLALGAGAGVLLLCWTIVLPAAFGLVFEGLVKGVYKLTGSPVAEEKIIASLGSTLRVLLSTLGWRILWPVVGILTSFIFGPLGLIVSAFGFGHIASIDAFDLALAMKGVPGSQRVRFVKSEAGRLFSAAAGGGVLGALLSISIVGWVFYYPAMFAGAALHMAAEMPTPWHQGSTALPGHSAPQLPQQGAQR